MKKGELGLIEWIRKQNKFNPRKILKGIGDDAAVFSTKNIERVIITTDMIHEGTHFNLKAASAYEIGWKTMAVNLSDCAAMGIPPILGVACVSLRNDLPETFAQQLYRGMKSAADKFGVDLIGGDIVSGKSVSVAVTLIGYDKKLAPIYRSGARVGDDIYVTGTLGGSIYGKHLKITARVRESLILNRRFAINAMIDISDGLSQDLKHICDESKCGALIYERDIPLSKVAQEKSPNPLEAALHDGEDFELLLTLSKAESAKLQKKKLFKTRLSKIGEIKKKDYRIVRKNGEIERLAPKGYEHLR